MSMKSLTIAATATLSILLAGCGHEPVKPDETHLSAQEAVEQARIPPPVQQRCTTPDSDATCDGRGCRRSYGSGSVDGVPAVVMRSSTGRSAPVALRCTPVA